MDSLLERLLRYVQVETTSVEETEAYLALSGLLAFARFVSKNWAALTQAAP